MIEIKDLTFSYDKKINILENINITIEKGSFVAILGPNGSGKSTIVKLLNGLLLPNEGYVLVDGFKTSDAENVWEIRRNLGLVFQNPDNQIVATIVEEDIAFGPENLGIPSEEIRRRIDDVSEKLNISNLLLKAPHELSGGQKQKIAIAGILAMLPKYIVFDESLSMLDPVGKMEVMELIKYLKSEGYTIILITHLVDEILLTDRVIVIDEKKVVSDSTREEFFSNDEIIEKLGLELPISIEISKKISDNISYNIDELMEEICR